MVFSHRQLNHPPLKSMVPSLSPHAVSISSSSQHNLSSSNKKAASSLHHSYHTRNNHGGKSRRQHALRLLCSHLFAFICAWQVGFLYSQLTIPCPSKRVKQRVGMDASHWKVRRPPSPPLPLPTGVRRAPAVASEDSRHHLSATTKNRTDLILGWSTVPYNEFVGTLDLGAPRQGIAHPSFLIPTAGSSQVLFLYPTLSSLPRHLPQPTGGGDNDPSASSLHNASNNCQVIKHIVSHLGTINERSGRTCLAIVGSNSNSYHLNKWMRQEDTLQQTPNNNNNQSKPMDAVSRYDFSLASNRFNGNLRFVPRYHITVHALEIANSFTRALDEAMSQLQPLADQVARAGDPSVQGTLVIMVCNFGHSELFANFVCAARANGVDVSKVLLFATDVETLQLGLSLNISTYYHEQLFSSIPNSAAELYGDDLYSKIMLSKAFASYLACETGYDFIFQDVDIIPYSPLYWAWWAAKGAGDYDLYFQEDFNGRAEYAPWYVISVRKAWEGARVDCLVAMHTQVLTRHSDCFSLRLCVQDCQFRLLLCQKQCPDPIFLFVVFVARRQDFGHGESPSSIAHGSERARKFVRTPHQDHAG